MNTFYMLVGLPGTGKSTWAQKQQTATIISTDNIIQQIADQYKLTYNQVFDNLTYSFAEKMTHKLARFAFDRNDDVIWDQTNLTHKSRGKKMELVPTHYKKIAVSFGIPANLTERLNSRQGKVIPQDVMDRMIYSYTPPSLMEGFDEIINVN